MNNDRLFLKIANDLRQDGYSINPCSLPQDLAENLYQQLHRMNHHEFDVAGIGRQLEHTVDHSIRTDEICWINGDSEAGAAWLGWASSLRKYLNSRLFLGLFSFESHFAHYSPGDFYKKHYDAFKGQSNRVLSLVVYLNPNWQESDQGELVLYKNDSDKDGIKVVPSFGTLVAFLSEEFPHEVLPAARDRYSIAGWFRLNTSNDQRIDPPQ